MLVWPTWMPSLVTSYQLGERPRKIWQCSSTGLIVGSQVAPLDGLDPSTATAKTIGNLHDATELSNDGERAARGRKQVAGPTQNDPVDSQKWHPIWPAQSQHDDLLFERQTFGFQRS